MSTFLRRYRQSIQHKYNCTFAIKLEGHTIGNVSLGTTAWTKLFAHRKAGKVVRQNLRLKTVATHRVAKGKSVNVYAMTFEVLFGAELVGQVERLKKSKVKWIARRIAYKEVRDNIELRHVKTTKYVAA